MSHSHSPAVRLLGSFVVAASLVPGIAHALDSKAPATDPDRASIAEAWSAYRTALVKSDAAAVAALFTEDGALLEPGIPDIEGRSTLEKFFAAGLSRAKVTDASGSVEQLDVYGDRAYEIGTYSQTVEDPEGESRVSKGRYAAFWVKGEDGRWRIHRIMVSPLPARREPAAEPKPGPVAKNGG